MGSSIRVSDTIESSGFPLGFRVRDSTAARQAVVRGVNAARDVFTVEARAMGGHQKEAVVTEGEAGTTWRLVSDEGPFLQGTDAAPFPLGFMNAGLAADVLGRLEAIARSEGIVLSRAHCQLNTDYQFTGSFFKGTGKGSARPPEFRFDLAGPATPIFLHRLVMRALDASPLVAMHRHRVQNTFALIVNGKRRELRHLVQSNNTSIKDPAKEWTSTPRPLAGDSDCPKIIERLPVSVSGASNAALALPAESAKLEISVNGRAAIEQSLVRAEVWLGRPAGTHFALLCDEAAPDVQANPTRAPSGLGLAMAGITFCLMTQVLRYVEYHKLKVRSLRVVQVSPFEIASLGLARSMPLDTHVFVRTDESDETIERLLEMAANTCYLHAALSDAIEPQVTVMAPAY